MRRSQTKGLIGSSSCRSSNRTTASPTVPTGSARQNGAFFNLGWPSSPLHEVSRLMLNDHQLSVLLERSGEKHFPGLHGPHGLPLSAST